MAGGGGGKGDDSDSTLFLLVGLIFVILWGLWIAFKQPTMEFIRGVKWAELSVFQIVDPSLALEREKLEKLVNNQAAVKQLEEEASRVKRKLTAADYERRGLLAPDTLWNASNRAGYYLRWPIAIVFIGLALFYMFYSKKNRFRTHYDLEGLMRVQAKQWPVIAPVINFNPADNSARNPGEPVPVNLPLFSEALSPEEWVAYNRIPLVNRQPDKEALRRAFQAQLGPRWTGLDCLTVSQRCLFAAFAVKGAQKRKESDALLGRIALCWTQQGDFSPTGELLSEVNKIINDADMGDAALEIANKYAWRTTALLGVLEWARKRGGVLAPASFVWLRAHDRSLWYPLNNLGRRSYHAEAAGVMAHYMAEKMAGRALPIPRLETAIFTLTQYWARDEFKNTNGPVLPPLNDGSQKKRRS